MIAALGSQMKPLAARIASVDRTAEKQVKDCCSRVSHDKRGPRGRRWLIKPPEKAGKNL